MQITTKNKTILIFGGAAAGLVNGFLGGGGGVVVVSLLLAVLKLRQKSAQATALLVILPLTVASAAVYIANGFSQWLPALVTTAGVVAGGVTGALLLSRLNGIAAKVIFALVLVAGGVKMLLC